MPRRTRPYHAAPRATASSSESCSRTRMPAASGHHFEITSSNRDAITGELKTPPLSRIASGRPASEWAWRKPASCRVTAGSCAYGNPSSCSATRALRCGVSFGRHCGKNPSRTSCSISAREISVDCELPMSRLPSPTTDRR